MDRPLPTFDEVEFRAYSENGEDGILLYIFSLIGATNKKSVEICAGSGITCTTANLIINHGWHGLLFDSNEKKIKRGKPFYSKCKDTKNWPPTFVHAWITTDNINSLISDHGFTEEIDLLSLDIDGVDYWIWDAIDCVRPRVVVLEYQDVLGPDKSLTIPNQPDFKLDKVNGRINFDICGASLTAFVRLGRQKGYRLVGAQRYGFNAFFIQAGVGEDIFPEIPVVDCFRHPRSKAVIENHVTRVLDREWVEV